MIMTVTAYPSRYANDPTPWELAEMESEWETRWATESLGRFYLRFEVLHADERKNAHPRTAKRQRALAELLGQALGEKPEYQRRERFYKVGGDMCTSGIVSASGGASAPGWTVSNGNCIYSGLFDFDDMKQVLHVVEKLGNAGLQPDGEITVHFQPERYGVPLIMNLCAILEARKELLEQALDLEEELKIIIDEDLALGIPLSTFDFERVEACICLLRQACGMAASTRKVRMQPCDMSNPKYQMRTWLLRLGFIGETFARPRNTLLQNLTGNGAFYTEDGKEKAAIKRRAARLIG